MKNVLKVSTVSPDTSRQTPWHKPTDALTQADRRPDTSRQTPMKLTDGCNNNQTVQFSAFDQQCNGQTRITAAYSRTVTHFMYFSDDIDRLDRNETDSRPLHARQSTPWHESLEIHRRWDDRLCSTHERSHQTLDHSCNYTHTDTQTDRHIDTHIYTETDRTTSRPSLDFCSGKTWKVNLNNSKH